jgi:AraC family transcriptional regulator
VKGNHRSSIASIQRLAHTTNACRVELEIVHGFKRNCAAERTICDIEGSSLAHLLAWRLMVNNCGIELPDAALRGSNLSQTAIETVCDYIEANLCSQITLEELAALVHLSPFHFARCFKASIGLAPHQYLIARRMELAKRLLLTSTHTVAEIAWSIGYENIGHFRRLFARHIGVTPGVIRRAAGIHPRA